MDWTGHTVSNLGLFRQSGITSVKANEKLGWKANYKMHSVVKMMVESEKRH